MANGSWPGAPAHVENIGPRGARRRLVGGVVWLAVGVAAAAWDVVRGAHPAAYAVLVIPFFLAAIGWLQARERT